MKTPSNNTLFGGFDGPDFPSLPTPFRARCTRPDGAADRRALEQLVHAGFKDVANRFDGRHIPTVPGASFVGIEFMPFRSDYLLTSAALDAAVTSYEAIVNERTGAASDHYPMCVTLNSSAKR